MARDYDDAAQKLMQRAKGFIPNINEAVILVLSPRENKRLHVRIGGLHSEYRSEDEIVNNLTSDLTPGMREALRNMFLPTHPIGQDNYVEADGKGTAYDFGIKLAHSPENTVLVAVLNDGECSLMERWACTDFGNWNELFVIPANAILDDSGSIDIDA